MTRYILWIVGGIAALILGKFFLNSVFGDTAKTPVTGGKKVDPVVEANVYLAYGRDAQAEEILLEAKKKDPDYYPVYLKLLEIYANRRAIKQFEALIAELHSETDGVGSDWEQALEMGRILIPNNPLLKDT